MSRINKYRSIYNKIERTYSTLDRC